jgi:hypothetical protein
MYSVPVARLTRHIYSLLKLMLAERRKQKRIAQLNPLISLSIT